MDSQFSSSMNNIKFRTQVLAGHFKSHPSLLQQTFIRPAICLSNPINFDPSSLRKLMDGKYIEDIDWLFGVISQSELFCRRDRGGKVFVSPEYNTTMEQQREMTMKRIEYLKEQGLFEGWFSGESAAAELRSLAFSEVVSVYDHSLFVKIGVHFYLW